MDYKILMAGFKKIIIPITIVGVILIATLFLSRKSVILRVPNIDSIRGKSLLVLFNPLRDFAPELVAETFLQDLSEGKCQEATTVFESEQRSHICKKQLEYPLKKWVLIDRTDENGVTWLNYDHWSSDSEGSEQMRLKVIKNDKEWSIRDFVIGY